MACTIVMATNLKVWSMAKGSGAPSFFKTLELYHLKGHKVILFTTEVTNPVPELFNVEYVRLPVLRSWNIRRLSSVKRILNYVLHQFIMVYFFYRHRPKVDLLYAYEIEFVPAMKIISLIQNLPLVTRFQGTILYPVMHSAFWRLRFFSHFFSLRIPSALTIMTNDGTKGDLVLSNIRKIYQPDKILFLYNGTSLHSFNIEKVSERIKRISETKEGIDFISVSRLERWKRVDRSLEVFKLVAEFLPGSRFIVVGDGNSSNDLIQLVEKYELGEKVLFTGSINSDEVDFLLNISDIFLSHYELSNVGNPLWEALRRKCLVVTLNNGDTGDIIRDCVNGVISKEESYLDNAAKIAEIYKSGRLAMVQQNGYDTYMRLSTSWEQRMEGEYAKVSMLLPRPSASEL